MLVVSTISFRFNICGEYNRIMKAKKGLRKGDPISHFLFVVVMYLHRSLHKISKIPDFNFHAKCEKLQIINVSFADDLLIFAREDTKSVELLVNKMVEFSHATGLYVSLDKYKAYFRGVGSCVKFGIMQITSFSEGELPFCYLSIPLNSRNLSNNHYMGLIDRIMSRIKH
ncbi:unnamed protein product [Lathyrus sativus]|nr:unnamed protein product [Lathyrus sativus]